MRRVVPNFAATAIVNDLSGSSTAAGSIVSESVSSTYSTAPPAAVISARISAISFSAVTPGWAANVFWPYLLLERNLKQLYMSVLERMLMEQFTLLVPDSFYITLM